MLFKKSKIFPQFLSELFHVTLNSSMIFLLVCCQNPQKDDAVNSTLLVELEADTSTRKIQSFEQFEIYINSSPEGGRIISPQLAEKILVIDNYHITRRHRLKCYPFQNVNDTFKILIIEATLDSATTEIIISFDQDSTKIDQFTVLTTCNKCKWKYNSALSFTGDPLQRNKLSSFGFMVEYKDTTSIQKEIHEDWIPTLFTNEYKMNKFGYFTLIR